MASFGTGRRKDGGVTAPIFLGGLFPDSDASDNEEGADFENQAENQVITIGDMQLTIRQYGYHQANANQVWPGTFVLADFLLAEKGRYSVGEAPLLELGSATGALAIYLRKLDQNFQVVTRYARSVNAVASADPPPHTPLPPLRLSHTTPTSTTVHITLLQRYRRWRRSGRQRSIQHCPEWYAVCIISYLVLYVHDFALYSH
jgi:hypothetical protein